MHSTCPNKQVPIRLETPQLLILKVASQGIIVVETNVTQTKGQDTIQGLVIVGNILNSS